MPTVTIDRATWGTGYDSYSELFSDYEHDRYCCLGFLGLACGATQDEIRFQELPSQVKGPGWPSALFDECPSLLDRRGKTWEFALAIINDEENVDHATRESWIAEGFKTILGYDVEYVGEYPEASL